MTLSMSPYSAASCSAHEIVAVCILFDALERLSRALCKDVVQVVSHFQNTLRANFDVAGLTFCTAKWLVNHDFAVRKA